MRWTKTSSTTLRVLVRKTSLELGEDCAAAVRAERRDPAVEWHSGVDTGNASSTLRSDVTLPEGLTRRKRFMPEKKTKVQSAGARRAAAAVHSGPEVRPYFSQDGLRFLRGLARNNHRDWFNDRKSVYETELKRPMLAVIEAVTDAMMDFAPAHVRPAESIMLRIYRDTRFSNEKVPYKTHVSGWWVRDGLLKTSGSGYYLHVSGKEVVIAFGVYLADAEQLLAIRRSLLEHHEEYRRLDANRTLRRLFPESEDGSPLSRSPKGFP